MLHMRASNFCSPAMQPILQLYPNKSFYFNNLLRRSVLGMLTAPSIGVSPMAGSSLSLRRTKGGPSIGQRRPERSAFCRPSGTLFSFVECVRHGRSGATEDQSRVHPDHRLRADRAGRGAGRLRAAGSRGRDPPRGLVGQRARQAGAGRARRLAHPRPSAAGADARHRQRQRGGDQRHDPAGERQRAHPVQGPVAGDGRGGT